MILWILDNQLGLKGISLLWKIRYGKSYRIRQEFFLLVQPTGYIQRADIGTPNPIKFQINNGPEINNKGKEYVTA